MAVPTVITDLSTTASSNSPSGSDTVGTTMDDFIRAHAGFIRQLYNGVSFHANKNATDQTGIASATDTKITFTNEEWDSASYYDAANSKFLPLRAGKYMIVGSILINATNMVDQSFVGLRIYKNGASIKSSATMTSGTGATGTQVSALVDLNGTTDYVELYAFIGGAGNKTVSGSTSGTYFCGHFIGT